MFKSIANAFKIKEIRTRLLFVLLCLVIVRIGSQLPVPGINRLLIQNWQQQTTADLDFLNMLTGGSFTQLSIFALNISPYITASIIMELLTIVIPKLEELHKDGESGRKKIAEISRYLTVGLAVIESIAMCIGFGNQGWLENGLTVGSVLTITAAFTAGSAFLMWLGEEITEKGVGNGISIILLINIVASLPSDFARLYQQFIQGKKVLNQVIGIVAIVAIVVVTCVLIILLQDAQRKISVQYARKVQGRKLVGAGASYIPLKVNTAGVIPVIFAMSLMQLPVIIASFFGVRGDTTTFGRKVLYFLSSSNWFDKERMVYTLGAVVYVALIIFFAYFYTSITFNPMEVSNNLKKQGGFIPGVRPGRPTTEFLTTVLNYIIVIGAVMLSVVALIPIVFSGLFNASVSFGGTSLIIIAGVIIETMRQVEGMMRERHYRGFLLED